MLRGLCDIQFHEVFVKLFKHGDGFGGQFGVQTAGQTYISNVLFAQLGNGEVITIIVH